MNPILEVNDLKKSYGKVEAVKGVSFSVEPGSLFAFLGPNGAGKSTTINMLCTLLTPDSGEILVEGKLLGRQDAEIRKSIGVVFQDGVLDPLLTVGENLSLRGSFYGLRGGPLKQAVQKAAAAAGVTDLLARRYGKLSGGQRRRADIARALVHTPKLLFLDEPTTGLDPQTRRNVWDTIRAIQKAQGMTVFLTTHYMEEAADADFVTVIDDGRIAAAGTPTELRERYTKDVLRLYCKEIQPVQDILKEMNRKSSVRESCLTVELAKTLDALPILDRCAPYLDRFETAAGSMDDVFLNITGKELREV